ncbi:MAG: DUF4190 domain-containing protein [Candidatus Dormibacteria bacterium]
MTNVDPTAQPPGPPTGPPQPPAAPTSYSYPQPQYAYAGYPATRGTNGFAIASLICAFLCWPLGLIFGFVARNQIKERGDGGEGLAIAGIIISFVALLVTVLYIVIAVAFISSHPNFNVYVPPQPT